MLLLSTVSPDDNWRTRQKTPEKPNPCHTLADDAGHKKRLSLRTSCSEGAPPVSGALLCSSRDTANARAALHAKTAPSPEPRRFRAAFHQCSHLPPTSAARATKRARPPPPDNSGKVRVVRRQCTTVASTQQFLLTARVRHGAACKWAEKVCHGPYRTKSAQRIQRTVASQLCI